MTRNEARDALDLPPLPDGDVPTVPMATSNLDNIINPPPPPAPIMAPGAKPPARGAKPAAKPQQNGKPVQGKPAQNKPAKKPAKPTKKADGADDGAVVVECPEADDEDGKKKVSPNRLEQLDHQLGAILTSFLSRHHVANQIVEAVEERQKLAKSNPNHDPETGEFTSGGGALDDDEMEALDVYKTAGMEINDALRGYAEGEISVGGEQGRQIDTHVLDRAFDKAAKPLDEQLTVYRGISGFDPPELFYR